ncbi:MAG: SLC13 family permease [Fulvivirga sp.]|uniref:SLC13 family permease n=1 Tax=Fulvivirga sp. TaxID=1931237 RepID=UPI0032EF077F
MIPIESQPYFVLGVILLLFTALYSELTKPAISFLFAALILVIGGVIIPKDIIDGLANESIVSIVLLILITAGFRSNFNIEGLLDSIFKNAKSYRQFLGLMMAKVAILSSFVNNTPVVVLMTPYVFEWGKKNKISPSKLLIPLSYATIFGGMITIIGTSTTLVLNGFLAKNGLVTINSLHLFYIGTSITLACIGFILLIGNRLLPSRQDLIEKFELSKREYLIEKRLSHDSELVGKTVKEGGLRNLKGVYLVEIVRNDQIISPVNPNEIIEHKDILIFAGNTDTIIDLTLSNVGIELPSNLEPSSGKNLQVVEGVISANNSLIGKTVKESNFRERYDAAVVAIHRNGERLSGKIGRIRIKAGDVLLMYVGKSFQEKVDLFKDLYIISGDLKEIKKSDNNDTLKFIGIFGIILTLLLTQYYSLFTSLLIITTVMVGMRLITLQNIKRDLDINMVIILILSLAIGQAMIKSGAGKMLAHQIVELLMPYGNIGLLIGLMLITTMLTSFITNVGAVAISFPLALGITHDLGVDGAPFFLAIAFAASAAFITPIGYQTNLIVYGPGGYNFKDFLKIGTPVTLIYLTIVVTGIILLYPQVFPV